MSRKQTNMLLAVGTVALLCFVTTPVRADYEFSLFGSPYWAPEDTDEVAGGGLQFEIPVGGTESPWGIDLRGSYFEETTPDAFNEAFEVGDNQGVFRENGLEVVPIEIGGRYNFLQDAKVRPYAGAGLGYYMLDTDFGDVNDETGYYGLVGLGIGNPDKAQFFVEANYRRMEATVEVDPDSVSDLDEGLSPDVGIDLDGLGFNLGVAFRFGG
jgi:outer membrane protein with beta-barrel domain